MQPVSEIIGLLVVAAVTMRASLSVFWMAQRRVVAGIADRRQIKALSARVSMSLDEKRQQQDSAWQETRPFQVVARQIENASGSICSFYLVPADGKPLSPFRSGQFLTLEIPLPNQRQPAVRCYSISNSPSVDKYYRITVKKITASESASHQTQPGLFSTFLHERIAPENILHVRAPSGSFHLNENSQRPVVLVGAGVGLTPLISMVHQLSATRSRRKILFFCGSANSAEHAMRDELKLLENANPNFRAITFYSRPSDACRFGIDYEFSGHVSIDAISRIVNPTDCEFYLCGPSPMMQEISSDLHSWGVAHEDIRQETFGVNEAQQFAPPKLAQSPARAKPIQIQFARSKKAAVWTPNTNSLLELAEASGVKARFGCRSGNCGTCMAAIRAGEVGYVREPGVKPDPGSCLICIAQPKSDLVLDL